jgi:iron complex transport system permease protein
VADRSEIPPIPHRRAGRWIVASLAALVCAVFVAGLCLGGVCYSPPQAWHALLGSHTDPGVSLIVAEIRLPRVALALLVGGALATAGLIMQTVTRNPLATPSVLGVTNGAHLAMMLWLVFAPDYGQLGTMLAAFLGALLSAGMIGLMGLSSQTRMDREYLVVGGSMMGALMGSALIAVMFLCHMYGAIFGWTLGGLIRVDWIQIAFAFPLLGSGLLLAMAMIARLEALMLGSSVAKSLGVRTGVYYFVAMGTVVLLAGTSVAVAGPVAYVGLIVPNLLSRGLIPAARTRLLACILGGALLTGCADTLSRAFSGGKVIPMGIWTMSIGAAFFLSLSVRGKPVASRPR